jgi:phenylpropionate dioxygenase-like ring-hydroxylating dioxygenase large terminal subunit
MTTSSHQIDSETLLGFWYPASPSARLRPGTMESQTLAGTPLVVGRDAHGAPFAFRDNCPHRGMPLSCGRLDGDLLECGYHGWRFDVRTGACRTIPALVDATKVAVERIKVTRFSAADQDGHVWVYMPDPAASDKAIPPVPTLPVFGRSHRLTHLTADVRCGFDEAVLSLLDPAHGPFVHQAWWWRRPRTMYEKAKTFEPLADGFRMQAHSTSSNSAPYKVLRVYGRPIETTIEFRLPSTRLEWTTCGPYWFSSRTVVAPVGPAACRLDFCAAWNLFGKVPLVTTLFRFFGGLFLQQDRRNLENLARGLTRDTPTMLLGDADQPARWYLQLRAAHASARRNGHAVQHPLQEAVTLRWRS